MGDLSGKVAVVMGSTSGVGLHVAKALARRGATVVLNGRNEKQSHVAIDAVSECGSPAVFEPADASNYEQLQSLVGRIDARFGRLDILVCSGADSKPGPTPFHELKPDDFVRSFEGRFLPRAFPAHAFLDLMKRTGGGAMVFVTTDAARHPTPGESLIGALGAGVILLTKALAREFSRWGIRVNCVALTITSGTPRYEDVFMTPGFRSELFKKAISRFPSGRAPNVSEVSDVVAFLASNESSQVTGQTISINGGLSFGGW